MTIQCDFCGKTQDRVEIMLSSETFRAICDDCVDRAVVEITRQRKEMLAPADAQVKP